MPVVARKTGKFNFLKVSANPIDGGYVELLSLICLPAGYFILPMWIIPLKKVPVVTTTFFALIVYPYFVLIDLIVLLF